MTNQNGVVLRVDGSYYTVKYGDGHESSAVRNVSGLNIDVGDRVVVSSVECSDSVIIGVFDRDLVRELISEELEVFRKKLLLEAYPVGSFYYSEFLVDPHELFGGTWHRVTDRYIKAISDLEKPGELNGSNNIRVVRVDWQHNHAQTAHQHSIPSITSNNGGIAMRATSAVYATTA